MKSLGMNLKDVRDALVRMLSDLQHFTFLIMYQISPELKGKFYRFHNTTDIFEAV